MDATAPERTASSEGWYLARDLREGFDFYPDRTYKGLYRRWLFTHGTLRFFWIINTSVCTLTERGMKMKIFR